MEIDKQNSIPRAWFIAEWISIIATFVVCFVFLFYQNQIQSARTDKLYEMYCEIQKENAQKWSDLLQKFYDKK